MRSTKTPVATIDAKVVNVAVRLAEMARAMPHEVALAEPGRWSNSADGDSRAKPNYRSVSFAWLDEDSSAIAAGLQRMGVEPGMRIALLVRPGIDFVSLVFALLKVGAVQVLIDAGMGVRNLVRSLSETKPQGIIGTPTAQMLRTVFRKQFAEARFNVTAGPRWLSRGMTLAELRRRGQRQSHFRPPVTRADSPAAIIFTSGSTGPAKGVLYRHGNFDRQVTEIRDFYYIQPGEIDVPCFPLFGLFNAAMGVTSVFPKMDFSRPARVDPRRVIAAVNDWQATQAFGSPAVWNLVGKYCEERGIRLSSLRRVLSAGAPVAPPNIQRMTACMHPAGAMHTPYGATEALPVASISSTEVLGETAARSREGAGVCVGRRFGGIEWRVIRIADEPIRTLDAGDELPRGEIGELIVRGPVVTTEYVNRPHANAAAKIHDEGGNGDGRGFWHRMGDVGYLDEHDRFWFCGRMSQRLTTTAGPMFTIPSEAVFNRHPEVFRSALVGVGASGQQRPVIVVEPQPGRMPRRRKQRQRLIDDLCKLAKTAAHTATIDEIFVRKRLPVDVRHNVKINREQLAVWAARKQRRRSAFPG